MKFYKKIKVCEVCGNKDLYSVLNLGDHPLCDDLIKVGDDSSCQEYPIKILFCNVCKTAHQEYQVEKIKLFPENYHYRSRMTVDVLDGMSKLVNSIEDHIGNISGKRVLDIGCNDGSLLGFFKKKGAITIGVEPTGAYIDALNSGHKIYNNYFDLDLANKISKEFSDIDIITFTNVFAHIENLPGLISALSILMGKNTKLVIENHYLGSVLSGNQFDTFYHEHPRTYSLNSFKSIASSLKGSIEKVEFTSRYGGNIQIIIGADDDFRMDQSVDNFLQSEEFFLEKFKKLESFISDWKISKRNEIIDLFEKFGPIHAKAFPGRAAILIKLLKLDVNHIEAVYEKPESPKIGHYIPGTRIPIKSDNDLIGLDKNPRVVVNLAWHISSEVRAYLNNILSDKVEIIDIV
jgi:SAM-dependent methyltransferase